jgi:hypothetical protein
VQSKCSEDYGGVVLDTNPSPSRTTSVCRLVKHRDSHFTVSLPNGDKGVPLDVHRMNPKYLDVDPACRSVASHILLREEPEDEEEENEEEHDGGEDDDGEDGYSE